MARRKAAEEKPPLKEPPSGPEHHLTLARLGELALAGGEQSEFIHETVAAVARALSVELCEVSEASPLGGSLSVRAGVGFQDGQAGRETGQEGRETLEAGKGSPDGYALLHKELLVFEDLDSDTRFSAPPLLSSHDVTSGMVAPISAPDGQFGALAAYSTHPRVFTAEEMGFLQAAAALLGQGLENRRLRSALKLRSEELERAEERKDDFFRMLSHELRNPLDSISLSLEVMRIYRLGDPAREELRGVLDRQVRHMTRLVDDLLDVSRVQSGQIRLRKAPVELGGIITNAQETVRPLLHDRGHRVSVTLPRRPVWIKGDAQRLEQVFMNLLHNAAKYTDPGGSIEVTGEREGDQAVVRVKDNGRGISPEMLPQVFDLFTQEDRSLDRTAGGLGIGLTVARKIVEMHGGAVEARSKGVGQGSEFLVRLPVLADSREETPPPPRTEADRAPPASPPRRVLVVDDNVDAAMMLATILARWGHQVHMVHDGPAAMQVVHSYRPEVLLLDIGLPGLDGFEIARRLRQESGLGGLVLVALTGYGREEDRRRSREVGFDYHLQKPVDLDALQGLLARAKSA